MSSPARGQGGMRPRGRGRGGSRSANNSDDETARQSGRGKRSSSARPPSNRGSGNGSARGAARNLNAALGQPNPSAGSGTRGARGMRNSPRPNGFQRAPSGAIRPPSINNALTQEQRWNQIKNRRDEERKAAMAAGIIVDPDRPRSLAEAVTPVGTCPDMCPEYERLKRIQQRDYFMPELVPSTVGLDRSQHRLDEARMVKAFKRSAAGSDEQLPSDLRPPQVLQQTCQYLFDTLLNEPNQTLKSAYVFIWDRTRAIRNDFSIQQLSKISDIRLAIECLEYIARFHILTLHQIGGRPRDGEMDRYDYYQDLEQLDKTLLSLINYYHNVRDHYHSPNEAEFRAYRIIYQITAPTPDVEDNVQLWPDQLLHDTRVQTALKLYDAAQSIRQPQGPLAKRIGHPIAQANWNGFFKLAKSKQTSYLMACVAEIYFNFVRHNALRAIWRSYRIGGEGRISDGWTLAELADGLGFDTEDQVRAFVENYSFKVVQKEDGELRLDVNSVGRSFPSPIVDRQTPQLSMSVVEPKRYGRTSTAIIYGLSVKSALEAGMVEEGYKLKGKHSTPASAGSPLRIAPSTTVNGSSASTGFQFSTPAQTSTPTKPPTSFAFLNQSDAVGAVGSEPQQRTFNFNFSSQGSNQQELEKVKQKRGRDTLFVTGESDDEDDSVTKQENSATTLATAAAPSSLNPFATAFASASTRTSSSPQAFPTPNLSLTPSPTSNPFSTTSTSGPSNKFSRPASSNRAFQFSSGQPATPATSTSNILSGAQTTPAAKSPVFNFTGQPSSATRGPTTSFSFTPTPPKSTIDKSSITSQSAQPFAFPPPSSSTIAGPTIDNKKSAAPFIPSALAPTSSSAQPSQSITAGALALTTSPVEQSQTIEERFLDQLAPILQDVEPTLAASVMDRVKKYILDPELVRAFVEAEKEVTRLQSLGAQTGDPGARARIMKLVQEARAARAFREDLVRKQYVAQFEEEQRKKKRAAEAEREKSFAHYKGIRTQEVLRFLTRHLAFYPRQPTFGIVPTFHVRMATNIFGEVIDTYEKEKREREREAQRIAEQERLEREQRRREKAKEMRARMKKSIERENAKKQNALVAQDQESAQADIDAHLEAQRILRSNESRPSSAVQHHRHDIQDESLQTPAGTNKSLPSNVLSTTATTEAITTSTSGAGTKRKRLDTSEGSQNSRSSPTLLELMSARPHGDKSASTFRSPYFRLKAAGLLPAQQRARQKRSADTAGLPPTPFEASSPPAKRRRPSSPSTHGASLPSSVASPPGALSSPRGAPSSPASAGLPQLDGSPTAPAYRARASRFGARRAAAVATPARHARWAAADAALERETQEALARVHIGGGAQPPAEPLVPLEHEHEHEPVARRREGRLERLERPRGGRGASADDAILLE